MTTTKRIARTVLYAATLSQLILLAACSSDDTRTAQPSPLSAPSATELAIATTAELPTRAAYQQTQGTQIAQGQGVYVWVDEHLKAYGQTYQDANVTAYINGWQLTADGAGQWLTATTTPVAEYQKQYYPASGYPVDIYALHGNLNKTIAQGMAWKEKDADHLNQSTLADGTAWDDLNDKLTHTVKYNQTGTASAGEQYTDGYELSDLMYARAYNRRPQDEPQPLVFTHLMSKIEVYLLPGDGMDAARITTSDSEGATIDVLNTLTQVGVVLKKKDDSGNRVESSTTAEVTKYYTLTPVQNTLGTISARMQYSQAGNDVPTGAPTMVTGKKTYAMGEAIVVPQYFNANRNNTDGATEADLLRITLPSGGQFLVQDVRQFETGKRYIYYVTIHAATLTVATTVLDWVDTTPQDVTPQLPYAEFNYNGTDGSDGSVQTYTVPRDGYYKMECWGAQGGHRDHSSHQGGMGGYASYTCQLTQGTTLYIAVGGQGGSTSPHNSSNAADKSKFGKGGWNGGGDGGTGVKHNDGKYYPGAGGGGGATHVSSADGFITDDAVRTGLYVVAGGGGGAAFNSADIAHSSGGAQAGMAGSLGHDVVHYANWYASTNGNSGQGAEGDKTRADGSWSRTAEGSGGGGGGYWGGNANTDMTTYKYSENGAGGSSWNRECGEMTADKWIPNAVGQGNLRTGHGYCRITYVGPSN